MTTSALANALAGIVAALLPFVLQLLRPYVNLDETSKRGVAFLLAVLVALVAGVLGHTITGTTFSSVMQSLFTSAVLLYGLGQVIYGVFIRALGLNPQLLLKGA